MFTISWRTTSLRRGGRAARRSCLPGLRSGGGGRLAGAAVLSCLLGRCELTAADKCVLRRVSGVRAAPPDTLRHRPDTQRTCLEVGADSVHTATPNTTKQSRLCRVWRGGVNWTIAINVLRRREFEFTLPKRMRCRQDCFVVSDVAM